uniref:Spectrin alpha chain, non-erythrocytic 1-like n=1 Tax=Sinocyclocheilus grahami TaxID=75366 RepID=A0A672M779_SINGR
MSSNAFDTSQVKDKRDAVNGRFGKIKSMAAGRRAKLNESHRLHQFFRDLDDEESWIKEKKLLVSSEDYGRDLTGVQNLRKKHKRLEAELGAHEPAIQSVLETGKKLSDDNTIGQEEIHQRLAQFVEHWRELKDLAAARGQRLEESLEYQQFVANVEEEEAWINEKLNLVGSEDYGDTLAAVQGLLKKHEAFETDFTVHRDRVNDVCSNGDELIKKALEETWRNLQKIIKERELELQKEQRRQEENDKLRQEFAQHANAFHQWLQETRSCMVEESGTLESQLEATKRKHQEIRAMRSQLKKIEDLGAAMEEALILDNKYTEHSTVGLAQQWDQLDQLGMRMQHNLEQQIQARNTTGVTEEALKEFSMMFKHFDKEKSGRLNHQEFKSCLRSLGYDLPMVEEGEPDPEFESILDIVDPNRDGNVSLQEYMAFMISRETENVKSSEEIESAFRALSAENKPYVTKEELYQNLTKEQADYCISHMKPYLDTKGREIPSAFDFVEFTRSLFVN